MALHVVTTRWFEAAKAEAKGDLGGDDAKRRG